MAPKQSCVYYQRSVYCFLLCLINFHNLIIDIWWTSDDSVSEMNKLGKNSCKSQHGLLALQWRLCNFFYKNIEERSYIKFKTNNFWFHLHDPHCMNYLRLAVQIAAIVSVSWHRAWINSVWRMLNNHGLATEKESDD